MDTKKAMAWFIVAVMVLGTFGLIGSAFFADSTPDLPTKEYNGFIFTDYGSWQLTVDGQDYFFTFFPDELATITVPVSLATWIPTTKIYLGYDPKEAGVQDTITLFAQTLAAKGIRAQAACTAAQECPDIPLLDCAQSQGIVITLTEPTGFQLEDKCLIIQAKDEGDLQKLTERFIYGLLGVLG